MKLKKTKKLKLKSIEEEAKACRKAFAKTKIGALVLHCHHEVLGEPLQEDAENRISYILSSKSQHEQALRLRLFRPVSDAQLRKHKKAYADRQKADADWQKAYADWQKAYADWQKADADWQKAYADWQKAYADWQKAYADLATLVHAKVCHEGCPWDGKTIFPKSE
jgi:hypothetical protein